MLAPSRRRKQASSATVGMAHAGAFTAAQSARAGTRRVKSQKLHVCLLKVKRRPPQNSFTKYEQNDCVLISLSTLTPVCQTGPIETILGVNKVENLPPSHSMAHPKGGAYSRHHHQHEELPIEWGLRSGCHRVGSCSPPFRHRRRADLPPSQLPVGASARSYGCAREEAPRDASPVRAPAAQA